jgi:hypothetical protein
MKVFTAIVACSLGIYLLIKERGARKINITPSTDSQQPQPKIPAWIRDSTCMSTLRSHFGEFIGGHFGRVR